MPSSVNISVSRYSRTKGEGSPTLKSLTLKRCTRFAASGPARYGPTGPRSSLEFSGEILDELIAKSKRLRYHAKVIHLPEVEPGSILEYSYKFAWHPNIPDILKNPGKFLIDGTYSYPTAHGRFSTNYSRATRASGFVTFRKPICSGPWCRPPKAPPCKEKETAPLSRSARCSATREGGIRSAGRYDQQPRALLLHGRVGQPGGVLARRIDTPGERTRPIHWPPKKIEQALATIFSPQDDPGNESPKDLRRVQQIRNLSYESEQSGRTNRRG